MNSEKDYLEYFSMFKGRNDKRNAFIENIDCIVHSPDLTNAEKVKEIANCTKAIKQALTMTAEEIKILLGDNWIGYYN